MMLVSLPSPTKTQLGLIYKDKANRRLPMILLHNKTKINHLSLRVKYRPPIIRLQRDLRQLRPPLRSRKLQMTIKLQVLLVDTTILFQQRYNMSALKVTRLKKKSNLSNSLKLWQNLCLRHRIISVRTSPHFRKLSKSCKKILISGILSY